MPTMAERWIMALFIGDSPSSARITTQGEDETDSCVEQIGNNLRKKESSRRDCHTIYNDVLCELSIQHDHIQW